MVSKPKAILDEMAENSENSQGKGVELSKESA
jgi:alpha-beta hydrolase superfamily lysophospholipase